MLLELTKDDVAPGTEETSDLSGAVVVVNRHSPDAFVVVFPDDRPLRLMANGTNAVLLFHQGIVGFWREAVFSQKPIAMIFGLIAGSPNVGLSGMFSQALKVTFPPFAGVVSLAAFAARATFCISRKVGERFEFAAAGACFHAA